MPAYHDKTALHPLDVENAARVSEWIRTLRTPDLRHLFCDKRVDFAYYAAWTMKTDETQAAKAWTLGGKMRAYKWIVLLLTASLSSFATDVLKDNVEYTTSIAGSYDSRSGVIASTPMLQ
ncbi:MAG: hypothetical protein R3B54_02715 [Bdellovibrionota bacterium]